MGNIRFDFEGTAVSGHDVPKLVERCIRAGPEDATRLLDRLTAVDRTVLSQYTRRRSSIDGGLNGAEGLKLLDRSIFCGNKAYTRELQSFYNGMLELEEYLLSRAQLVSWDADPIPADRLLFLFGEHDGKRFKYRAYVRQERRVEHKDGIARITVRRAPAQRLYLTGLPLERLAQTEPDAARYVLTGIPPTIRHQQSLVRLLLRNYVSMKRSMQGATHYPVLTDAEGSVAGAYSAPSRTAADIIR